MAGVDGHSLAEKTWVKKGGKNGHMDPPTESQPVLRDLRTHMYKLMTMWRPEVTMMTSGVIL